MTRIGIDARLYGPKQGGLGRYVEQLILNLEKLNPSAEFVIFLKKEAWDEYKPSRPNFEKVLADIPWYGWEEQVKLPGILDQAKVDLMHFPHWNVPLFYRGKFIVTIHDLLLYHFPTQKASTLSPVTYFIKQLIFKAVLKKAAKKALKILTVSNFSKQDITTTLGVDPEKILVTCPAPAPKKGEAEKCEISVCGVKKPFVLYVGSAFPHKNLERLIRAWESFCEKNDFSHQLVLSGKKNYFYDRLIKKFIHLFEKEAVVFTDFVSDNQLEELYKKCSLFIYPSLYEGFGIPPLEAMSHCVPVAASGVSCIPEVLQGAALYFNPESEEEILRAIETGISDEKLREELVKLGLKLTKKYDWLNLAKSTWEIYKNSV